MGDLYFFPQGHPQQVLKGQEYSGTGCLKFFWIKGKNQGIGGVLG